MGIINNHKMDNGDVEVYLSYYLLKQTSESVPDPDNTPIESIYDDELDQLLEFLHSVHDDDFLDLDLQMLQY